jgi:hypothetical protein
MLGLVFVNGHLRDMRRLLKRPHVKVAPVVPDYQLDLVTPGIIPAEAISRKVIRDK